jgi:amino acid adenylation domain-containing protein
MTANPDPAHPFVPFENRSIDQSIAACFEQQVGLYPNRAAVVTSKLQCTYAELNQIANGIARAVISQLGERQEPVALLFEEGALIVAAILGVLKAGKIYLPLNQALPQARTASMLEDSQARLLLTNGRYLPEAQELVPGGPKILNLEDEDIDLNVSTGELDRPISADAGAVILYTSGSTGQPKGVLHSHRNILVETRNYTNDVQICPEDRLSQCHSCSFVNSIRNIFGALLNGATLFPYDVAAEGVGRLAEWIHLHRITIFHTVPTLFRGLLDSAAPDTTFPAVRLLRIGGEPISNNDVKRFQHHFPPPCVLMHVIGPTETLTIRRYFITHDWRGDGKKVPVGYTVPDKEIVLLDRTGSEVGTGQIGEIAVRSKYLALGYWRQPELTRAAFIADPRGGDERLYLTGDMGTMHRDGCLILVGRKDFQVKIRGYRVEVAEIEEALLSMDGIKAAIVNAHADEAGDQRLIAYVVAAPTRAPVAGELRRILAQTLPDYMVPSVFVFMDSLPLLSNGKIDRRALPAPNHGRPILKIAYLAPRTAIESDLARIWADVFELEAVGVHDDFLELGGDSLRATRIISRARNTFGVEFSILELLNAPTVARMAKLIVRADSGEIGH